VVQAGGVLFVEVSEMERIVMWMLLQYGALSFEAMLMLVIDARKV
jgi:hypothetical protein